MYEGDNPVALQSQDWILTATLALMQEVPYRKITVRDICKKADLSRQTFYNCFEEKDEVLRYYLRNCYAEMKQNLPGQFRPIDLTDAFAAVFERHESDLRLMLNQGLDFLLREEISRALQEFLWIISATQEETRFSKYGRAFLDGAFTSTLIEWFRDETPLTREELAQFLLQILSGHYYRDI